MEPDDESANFPAPLLSIVTNSVIDITITLVATCAEIGSYGHRRRSPCQNLSHTTTAKEHRSSQLPEEISGSPPVNDGQNQACGGSKSI